MFDFCVVLGIFGPVNTINPFRQSVIFNPYQLDESIHKFRGGGLILCIILTKTDVSFKQTVKTLMRHRIMQHLIWVCTVYLYPIHRKLGIL